MSASSYDEALARLLVHEGGNDDDPRDPGGRTSRGILQREWDKWRQTRPGLPTDVWEAPQDQVVAIYRQKYWDVLRCDDLPPGVDYAVFDYGVNSGIGRSAKVLQGIVGVDQDGEIGPLTLAAVANFSVKDLVGRICDERLSFLQGLKTWPTFGRGWARRVAEVRAAALDMAAHAPTLPPSLRIPVEPPWTTNARKYIGFHEIADNRGIEEFIEGAHTGSIGDPWCAIFVNFNLETVGVPGTRSAMARSFEHDANFVRLSKPILGCIVTMWRVSQSSGSGHVGFFVKQDAKNVYLLDGNANDEVGIHQHPADRITGYWWPKSVPQTLPEPPMTDPVPALPTEQRMAKIEIDLVALMQTLKAFREMRDTLRELLGQDGLHALLGFTASGIASQPTGPVATPPVEPAKPVEPPPVAPAQSRWEYPGTIFGILASAVVAGLQAKGTVGTPFGMGLNPTDTGSLATIASLASIPLGMTGMWGKLLGGVLPLIANAATKAAK